MVECWTLICSKFNGENADHLLIDWWIIVRLSLKWTEAGAECLEVAPRQVGKKRAMGPQENAMKK